MFHSVSLLSQAPLARRTCALSSVLLSHSIPYHGHLPGFWKIHNNLGLSMEFIIHYKQTLYSFTAGEVLLAADVAEHVVVVCQLVSPNSGKDTSFAELDSIDISNAVAKLYRLHRYFWFSG